MTDKRTRTGPAMRHIFAKFGGALSVFCASAAPFVLPACFCAARFAPIVALCCSCWRWVCGGLCILFADSSATVVVVVDVVCVCLGLGGCLVLHSPPLLYLWVTRPLFLIPLLVCVSRFPLSQVTSPALARLHGSLTHSAASHYNEKAWMRVRTFSSPLFFLLL